jgi:hypothetical protein
MTNLSAITRETLTDAHVRNARERWPEDVSAERAANALGLPERHTVGGLPIYPPAVEISHAREQIANLVRTYWNEGAGEWADRDPGASK